MVLGVAAGVYLVATTGGSGAHEVPTEIQVLGGTTTVRGSGSTTAPKGVVSSSVAKGVVTTTTGVASRATKDAGGFTLVRVEQLPKEAQETLARIDKGGPFPYARDGIVFQNREQLLPKKASAYYREYTVVTPGESDRGARRVIVGIGGERYYTADHYGSFVRIEAAP